MSIIHNIIYKKPLDVAKLDKYVSTINGATYENRGEDVLYFWIDGKSTRGFDITFEQGYIEVRNTILSNKHDYDFTNKVVVEILSLTDGIVINEDKEQISNFPLFDNDRIAKMEIDDCKIIQLFSKEHEDVAIYGPIRIVHFGKRLHEQFKELNDEQLKDKMFDTILNVNYKLPNFEYGNIMQIGDTDEDKKTLKLLTNKTDYMIDKYDYILINKDGEEQPPIMITNAILNTMLPSNWTLVDEFTVVAPMTDKNEWNKLLTTAEKYDLTEEFLNNRNASH
jgi:hypothetical protein